MVKTWCKKLYFIGLEFLFGPANGRASGRTGVQVGTTGHSRFGWGSHQRRSQARLKKMSYKQKTVFAHETNPKNHHNSVSRPFPGMIPGAKSIMFAKLEVT